MKSLMLILLLISLAFNINAKNMSISSSDIQDKTNLKQNQIANFFGCSGKNLSPGLSWINIPRGSKSLAVTLYDPDALTKGGYWHWIVYNIKINTRNINSGASNTNNMPVGAIEAPNSSGKNGYLGACPPKGTGRHRYELTLYALDVDKLPVTIDTDISNIIAIINQHTINKAAITGYAENQ